MLRSDADDIRYLLEHHFGWDGGRAALQQLLGWSWFSEEMPRALVVEAEHRVVGFLATILSPWPRTVPPNGATVDRAHLLGSFSFYHVLPEFRASSLPLLKQALALADRWTSLSPNAHSQAILGMAGFRTVSQGFRFLAPSLALLRRGGWRARLASADRLESFGLARVARDHSPYGCRALIASKGECHVVVFTKRRFAGSGRFRVPVSEVLFVSEASRLSEAWPALSSAIAWHDKVPLIALDEAFDPDRRITGGRARTRIRMARGLPEGTAFDALYSELVLLNQ